MENNKIRNQQRDWAAAHQKTLQQRDWIIDGDTVRLAPNRPPPDEIWRYAYGVKQQWEGHIRFARAVEFQWDLTYNDIPYGTPFVYAAFAEMPETQRSIEIDGLEDRGVKPFAPPKVIVNIGKTNSDIWERMDAHFQKPNGPFDRYLNEEFSLRKNEPIRVALLAICDFDPDNDEVTKRGEQQAEILESCYQNYYIEGKAEAFNKQSGRWAFDDEAEPPAQKSEKQMDILAQLDPDDAE